jgi:uncharacterized membrane protein (UPF0136 family)
VSANVLVKDHACESTYKLAASIALHSVSLAVTSEVVGTAALVASSGTRVTTIPTAESTVESPARSTGTTTGTRSRSGAVASEMAGLVAVVAAAVSSTVETQSRTIGLNVA